LKTRRANDVGDREEANEAALPIDDRQTPLVIFPRELEREFERVAASHDTKGGGRRGGDADLRERRCERSPVRQEDEPRALTRSSRARDRFA
jgi:hypothetical protein